MKETDDTIYDLEGKESAPEAELSDKEARASDGGQRPEEKKDGNPDNPDKSVEPEAPESPATAEVRRLMDEMGAETLLDIIRDNRNAAIRQIIREVEASHEQEIPSGLSSDGRSCSSIFDLAALA